MKEIREKLEKMQLEVSITKDLSKILDEHFQITRYKDNVTLDHWSMIHLFGEYTTLSYTIGNKLNELENLISDVIATVYTMSKSEKM